MQDSNYYREMLRALSKGIAKFKNKQSNVYSCCLNSPVTTSKSQHVLCKNFAICEILTCLVDTVDVCEISVLRLFVGIFIDKREKEFVNYIILKSLVATIL